MANKRTFTFPPRSNYLWALEPDRADRRRSYRGGRVEALAPTKQTPVIYDRPDVTPVSAKPRRGLAAVMLALGSVFGRR